MVTFARCEQEADDILAECLRDAAFHRRLMNSSSTWGWEFTSFLRRVRLVVAIALFCACRSRAEQTPAEAAAAGLRILREGDAVALFGVLPAAEGLGESAALVQWLRLISIGLTGRSAISWERLAVTATSVLDPDSRSRPEWLLITGVQKRPSRWEREAGGISGEVTVRLEDPSPGGRPDSEGPRACAARGPEGSGGEQAVEE